MTLSWLEFVHFGRLNPHTCVLMRTSLSKVREEPKSLTEKFFILSFHMERTQEGWQVEIIIFGADFSCRICLLVSSSKEHLKLPKDFILAKLIWNKLKHETLPTSQEMQHLLTLLIVREISTALTHQHSSEFPMSRCTTIDLSESLTKLSETLQSE